MATSILQIYHQLPYTMQVVAASLRGYYLNWWRYGTETEKIIEETLDHETWSEMQWSKWREERLSYVLHRAATLVPYYRQQWEERRRKGDHSSWELLSNWPILSKETIRANPEAFITDDCDKRKMFIDHTGGTTGKPLNIYLTRNVIQKWYAIYEARIRHWNGVSIKDRWAILGGQMVTPLGKNKKPFWVMNYGLNQLYLSSFHINQQNVASYVEQLIRYQPTHLIVYPSSANYLAQLILEQGLIVPNIKVIITNSEILLDSQRDNISRAFHCPVRNTYGMGEIALGASECEEGKLHIWPESGVLEVVDENSLPSGEMVGDFILTGLINDAMPLIRYSIGDRGYPAEVSNCNCQRKLPVMRSIEGRSSDLIITPDGRKIYWLNPVFYDLPIREGQIIQESICHIRVLIVPANGFNDANSAEVVRRLQQRLGDNVTIQVELVNEIPRTSAGKFKPVVSKV